MSDTLSWIIQAVISLVFVSVAGVIIKIIIGKLFDDLEERINAISKKIDLCTPKTECELRHVNVQQILPSLKDKTEALAVQAAILLEKINTTDLVKQDLLREISSINAEFTQVHNRLDRLQEKIYNHKTLVEKS